MQALKNIIISGAMILALLFGITLSTTAAGSSFEEVKARAEQGDSFYQGSLGIYYSTGQGVRQDHSKAFYWYQKAADQGDEFGQFKMGVAYFNGKGVRQDYTKALEWLKKAAKQNNPSAQGYIGTMYEDGDGVPQNKMIAKEWYGKGCDNGSQISCDEYKRLNEQGY